MLMQPSTDLYIMLTSIDGSVGLVVLPEFSSVPFIQNFCVMFDCSSLKILVKSDPLFSSPVRRSILWHYQEHAIFQLKKFPDVIDRKWIIIWSTDGSLLAKEAWLNMVILQSLVRILLELAVHLTEVAQWGFDLQDCCHEKQLGLSPHEWSWKLRRFYAHWSLLWTWQH